MQVRRRAFEPRHVLRRHHLDHHRVRPRRLEWIRADQKQPHDQGTQVADGRNGESRANVSLQSVHLGLSRYRPRALASYIIPADWYVAFLLGSLPFGIDVPGPACDGLTRAAVVAA